MATGHDPLRVTNQGKWTLSGGTLDSWLWIGYNMVLLRSSRPSTQYPQSSMKSESTLFDTVHQRDPLGFWREGRFEPRRVANFLDISRDDASKMANISKKSVRYDDHVPGELLSYLRHVANICNLVAEAFDGDVEKTVLWFTTANPMLGDVTPRDMIRVGRYKKLEQFVLSALGRQSAGRSLNFVTKQRTKHI